MNFNFIESEDGLETLLLIYKSNLLGINISLIFSDENMVFMKGSQSCKIINSFYPNILSKEIPFCIVTSYDPSLPEFKGIPAKRICSKPLDSYQAFTIFKECLS